MKRIDITAINDGLLDIQTHELIVLSTYFTSKKDPQRDVFQEENDFQYIKNWYESIVEHDLVAFVFHDGLSDSFIVEYQNWNVRFIECNLGAFSLNDERFFIYTEFFDFLPPDIFVLATDINDVVVNRNPISIFDKAPQKLFIGGGNIMEWRYSFWTLFKMKELYSKLNVKLPPDILYFPVFNAGLIGGRLENVRSLLSKMMTELDQIGDAGNYNMPILNYVLHRDYYNKQVWYIKWFNFSVVWNYCFFEYWLLKRLGILKYFRKVEIDTAADGIYENLSLYSGFPFNSMFKRNESKDTSMTFLIHK